MHVRPSSGLHWGSAAQQGASGALPHCTHVPPLHSRKSSRHGGSPEQHASFNAAADTGVAPTGARVVATCVGGERLIARVLAAARVASARRGVGAPSTTAIGDGAAPVTAH